MITCNRFQRSSRELGKGLDAFIIFQFTLLNFIFTEEKKSMEKNSLKATFLKQTSMFFMGESGTMNFMTASILY